jgi:hypothetical protein
MSSAHKFLLGARLELPINTARNPARLFLRGSDSVIVFADRTLRPRLHQRQKRRVPNAAVGTRV